MKKVLSIAGSDCSGGAGIQADIKTIMAHKMYAMTVITAVTAQNTTGVFGVYESSNESVSKQIDAIFTDIVPDATKIGMVSSNEIIKVIAKKLVEYNVQNIVLDPVMISTTGSKLLDYDAVQMLTTRLMPLAKVITPNIPEAESLSGIKISTKKDMESAMIIISKNYKGYILIKGGHSEKNSDDLLFHNGDFIWFEQMKIKNSNTHGTGCTLSSAIACGLAEGYNIEKSIKNAKNYITGALKSNLNLGSGSGPLNHCFNI